MKASILAASVLAGSVAASSGHKGHGGYHLRRGYEAAKNDVCTVYTTVYVHAEPTYAHNSTAVATSTPCPEESSSIYTPAPPAPTKESYPEVPAPHKPEEPILEYPGIKHTPSPKPEYPVAPKPEYPAAPKSEYPAAPKPAPTSSKAVDHPKPTGGYSSGGRIVVNGNKWSITYTPYAADGTCRSGEQIKGDIKKIHDLGYQTIRSYSTDCGVFEYVVPECQKYGMKVIYGIFLEKGGKGPFSQHGADQLEAIKKNAPKDSVAMVIVGNECIFSGACEAGQLASYIDYVRKELRDCGFPSDIAVTTTEPVGTWEQYGAALCDHIDVFACQVHPFFTSSVSAEEAGDFAAQQLEQAAKVCPGAAAKGKYITEIGWPSAGNANGKAVAGKQEQKVAMEKIIEKVGSEACIFSYDNDTWKAAGAYGVEQYFGCSDILA